MAEIKNFPNNVDEYIGAQNVMKWLHGRTSGVFGADGNLSVTANGNMTVSVSDGVGHFDIDVGTVILAVV